MEKIDFQNVNVWQIFLKLQIFRAAFIWFAFQKKNALSRLLGGKLGPICRDCLPAKLLITTLENTTSTFRIKKSKITSQTQNYYFFQSTSTILYPGSDLDSLVLERNAQISRIQNWKSKLLVLSRLKELGAQILTAYLSASNSLISGVFLCPGSSQEAVHTTTTGP